MSRCATIVDLFIFYLFFGKRNSEGKEGGREGGGSVCCKLNKSRENRRETSAAIGADVGAHRSLIGAGAGHVLNGGGVGWVAQRGPQGASGWGQWEQAAPVAATVGPRWSPLVPVGARWVGGATSSGAPPPQPSVGSRRSNWEDILVALLLLFLLPPGTTPSSAETQVWNRLQCLVDCLINCSDVWKRVRSRYNAAFVSCEEEQLQPLSAQEATADLFPPGKWRTRSPSTRWIAHFISFISSRHLSLCPSESQSMFQMTVSIALWWHRAVILCPISIVS